jgi:hypothetical protein
LVHKDHILQNSFGDTHERWHFSVHVCTPITQTHFLQHTQMISSKQHKHAMFLVLTYTERYYCIWFFSSSKHKNWLNTSNEVRFFFF